jgi:type II secretory pathway pseudopilin PulG
MGLQGQPRRAAEAGYAMATLLVALAVMSVLMSAVLPAWRHQATREKEAELVFRGEQYVRAIQLWERKMGPGSRPPNVDMLVQQKFLRKKYKDPMTEDGEFQPVFAGVNPGPPGLGGRGAAGPGGRGQTAAAPQPQTAQPSMISGAGPGIAGGGIHGVMSKSQESSIRVYKGATRYSDWRFIHAGAATTPGGPGSPVPGGRGRGQPGLGPDGRGMPGPGGRGPGRGVGPGIGPGPGGRGPGPSGTGGPGGRGRGQ